MIGSNENYLDALQRIALDIVTNSSDEVLLENKVLIAIAIRLSAEQYLKGVLSAYGLSCPDSSRNQTRDWYNLAEPYITSESKSIIDDVNLITPESIHINSFMFEPLIDVSAWSLKDLYNSVLSL
jgi:hypothetical protein